jgi:subtilisin family serine protease
MNEFKQAHISSLHYSTLHKGFTVDNVTTEALSRYLQDIPVSLHRSKIFRASKTLPWGIDRLDQKNLPLDGKFRSDFNGSGVNVFIVDTGIDTTHVEFRGSHRKVANVFDSSGGKLETNNDALGHGTHTAATATGLTVGVASAANVYGVKVLNDEGAGTTTDIISGLEFVLDWYLQHNRPPTIVSLSLGGDCLSYSECENDLIVLSCEKLVSQGITVVAAAGNDGCDSCLQTPAFAPNIITVGASDREDKAAHFSDYGKCVDIYAPGVDVLSACTSRRCGGEDRYITLSGTSMAAPHATGVAAMIYQVRWNRRLLSVFISIQLSYLL